MVPPASLALLGVFAVTVGGPRSASAQCRYSAITFTGPNDPVLGPPATVLTGVNNLDQAVGFYFFGDGPERGFVWSEETGMVTLPRVPGGVRPLDINDAGQITGEMGDSPGLAFLWDGQQYIELGIPEGGTYSSPAAINNDGVIVGTWVNAFIGIAQGFIWEDGVLTDVGPILHVANSDAADINDGGRIAGSMGMSRLTDFRAFILTLGAPPFVRALPPGSVATESRALNAFDDLGGFARYLDVDGRPSFRAIVWRNNLFDVIPPFDGFRNSDTSDLNVRGTTIGRNSIPISRAFVWQNGVVADLEALIDSPVPIRILFPSAINDNGVIVGSSSRGATVLTPIYRAGDLNRDCQVDLFDLAVLLSDFGCTNECEGDVDGDGQVALSDLGIMLSNWGG